MTDAELYVTSRRYNMGTPHGSPRSAVWLENRRTQKWVKMIGKQLEDWEVCVYSN